TWATAARPISAGEAPNAAFMPPRAFGVCMRANIASNSALSESRALDAPRCSALNSSTDRMTAFGASCFVMTTVPPRRTVSRTRPNCVFASVAVTDDAASPRRLRTAAMGSRDQAAFMAQYSHFAQNDSTGHREHGRANHHGPPITVAASRGRGRAVHLAHDVG